MHLIMILISLSVFVLKPAPGILRFYPIYFLGDFILGIYLDYTSRKGIYNTGVSDVYEIADFSFLYLVLRGFIVNQKMRKNMLFITIISAFFEIINLVFIQKKVGLNPINFSIQCLITVVFCIYYFFELFRKAEDPSLSRLPSFWITTAILFNIVLGFPFFAFMSFMEPRTKQNDVSSRIIFDNIVTIYNIIITITYTLYSIGFLCRIRIKKYTS